MDEVEARLGIMLGTKTQMQHIKSVWLRLQGEAFTGPAEEIFIRHTKLIAQVLQLVKHVSDTSKLTLDSSLDSFYMALFAFSVGSYYNKGKLSLEGTA